MGGLWVLCLSVLSVLAVVHGRSVPAVLLPDPHCYSFTDLGIAAFNIQVFGRTKMSKPHVVEKLEQILTRYDLVLIQEIRDSTETAIYQLLDGVNRVSASDPYGMVLSPRLGRTSSKEQYAYFYRQSKLSVVSTNQWPEDGDIFERPPYSVRFRADNYDVQEFAYMGIHVKPDDAVAEIDAMVDVYDQLSNTWNIQDFILGGDFNAGCNYVRPDDWDSIRLRTQSRFLWLLGDETDTTISTSSCPYDRLVLAGSRLQGVYKAGTAKAYRFDDEMGLTQEQAKEVSDHVPVEMEVR